MIVCKRCGGEVVQKSRARLLAVGAMLLCGLGLFALSPWWWGLAVLLGTVGAYLWLWAWLGDGRWCRGCKRFDRV